LQRYNLSHRLKSVINKQTKSLSNIPSFLQTSSKAMKDYIRDSRRVNDRENMNSLMDELRRERRDENSKRGGYKFTGNNKRIIKKKDIRIQNKRGL
jgi:hypothetical protein